jgi:flagellar motility protein MotE (MotC chaperone)
MSNPKKIFLKYSKYSYILIGALVLSNYLPKVLGLFSTILMGSIGKILGKSSKVGPSVTSKIAAEVENLAQKLNKDTPKKIVKNVESAAKLVRQLTEETSPVVVEEVVKLLDDIEINLEESEDLQPQPKQGRPSEAWKRVKKMVKEQKFKDLIEDEEKMEELPKKSNWDNIEKMVKEDKANAAKSKGFFEELFDDTAWANEDIKQTGGGPSYLQQRQLGFLVVALSTVHYLDYSSDCKNYETSDLFSSGLFTIIVCMLIFILITKIGLYARLHMMLRRRNIGVIADVIDGGLVFFIYNMIKNIRDVVGYNKCSSSLSSINASEDITNIQNYISSLEVDIQALQDKIAEEKTLRETYQTELEAKIAERTAIVDALNEELDAEISAVDSNYATITEKQEDEIEALDTRIEVLETKISDLVVSQAELQTLLESRISVIEITQTSLKSFIEGNTASIDSNTSTIGSNSSSIEANTLSIANKKIY